MNKKGFTLIELLVVIAIIGILAAIVFVNVSSARNKAKDTSMVANMTTMLTAAEVFYSDNSTYVGTCTATTGNFYTAWTAVKAKAKTTTQDCDESASAWRACAQLNAPTANTWYCADSTGARGTTTDSTCGGATATACPALTAY